MFEFATLSNEWTKGKDRDEELGRLEKRDENNVDTTTIYRIYSHLFVL